MKFLKLLVLLSGAYTVQMASAQSISRSVIGSSGTTQTMENQRISWTVGEPVIGTMTGSEHQLSNGFFQSLDMSVFLLEPEKESLTSIEVFPNPASDNITIRNKEKHSMSIAVTGQDNKLIQKSVIASGDLINVSHWKSGVYFLNVIDNINKQETIFKIVIL